MFLLINVHSGHGSAIVGGHSIAVFGGKLSHEVYLNDIFILDVGSSPPSLDGTNRVITCTVVNAVDSCLPTPVSCSSMIAAGNRCIVFGGTDREDNCYSDIRMLDITDYVESDITVGQGAVSEYSFKILIIGDANVGKSALLTRFSENIFLDNYTATSMFI